MQQYTIIIVLWKHRLSLSRLKKPSNVRIIVVAPPRMLADESCVDVYYQVDPWIRTEDCQMIQKVRELCAMYTATQRRILVFERMLQRSVAQIRKDMNIEGYIPEQLDLLLSARSALHNPKRNGLTTLKQCSLSGTPQPDHWVEAVRSQIGGFPAVVKPLRPHCSHSIGIVRNESEFRQWFRRLSNVHRCEEYVVQEFVDDGYEFSAICSAKHGLIGCISSIDSRKTVLECIHSQQAYALELLSVAQTRDLFPGLESFSTQVLKSAFPKGYTGAVIIKGFYKNHNDIFFLGFSLEPESESFQSLLNLGRDSHNWDSLAVDCLYDHPDQRDEVRISSSNHILINFPSMEGVLIHQTSIPKRKTSDMRVSWRMSEGHEMADCDGIDDNIVQVFMTNDNRQRLHEECRDIMTTEVTVDRTSLAERHCRRHGNRHTKELIRSCTTAD